jgi:hypothetical protein
MFILTSPSCEGGPSHPTSFSDFHGISHALMALPSKAVSKESYDTWIGHRQSLEPALARVTLDKVLRGRNPFIPL